MAALVAAVGCSSEDNVVSKADVEAEAATQLAESVGSEVVPDISCPDDLQATVGTTMECTLSVEGDEEEYAVTVTVDSVEDGEAQFTATVANEPLP